MTQKSSVDSSGQVKLGDVAEIRTGFMTTRNKNSGKDGKKFKYKLLNLKCIDKFGFINSSMIEDFESCEKLKSDFLTRKGDILIRLSFPYTVVFIDKSELYGLLVPSHFAIIRTKPEAALPEYVFWALKRAKSRALLMQRSSVTSALATIPAAQIEEVMIPGFSLEKQKTIGNLFICGEREFELSMRLANEKRSFYSAFLEQLNDKLNGENDGNH